MPGGLWNEVAPVAPLLIPLAEITGALTVIGLIAIVTALVAALVWVLNQTVGRVPLIGGVISVAVTSVASGVTNELAKWSHAAHQHLGAALHSFARIGDWLGHEIEQHSRLLYALAALVLGPATANALWLAINRLLHRQAQQQTWNQAQQRENHATRAHVKKATREAHIAHKTAVAVPGHVAREWDIPRLREHVRADENKLARLWEWARTHAQTITTDAAVAAIAVALTRMGLNWIRCRNWNRLGKSVCRLPFNLIEELLALSGYALAVLSVLRPELLAEAAVATVDEIEPLLQTILSE